LLTSGTNLYLVAALIFCPCLWSVKMHPHPASLSIALQTLYPSGRARLASPGGRVSNHSTRPLSAIPLGQLHPSSLRSTAASIDTLLPQCLPRRSVARSAALPPRGGAHEIPRSPPARRRRGPMLSYTRRPRRPRSAVPTQPQERAISRRPRRSRRCSSAPLLARSWPQGLQTTPQKAMVVLRPKRAEQRLEVRWPTCLYRAGF
jgi:hypothetical protein